MRAGPSFCELVAEGDAVPVEGWDFSWFDGRATEERPAWGYAGLLASRLGEARAVLDVQTGGGEVLGAALAKAGHRPGEIAATESWPPNVALARERLGEFGVTVAQVADDDPLPFAAQRFDLVVSRHPTVTLWPEVARVLTPGGRYLSQQVGPGSNRELTDFMMGPQPVGTARHPDTHAAAAAAAGLEVTGLRAQSLRVEFFDVAAVVHFLKKVPWTVPGFTVAGYAGRLRAMHEHISARGSFVCHSQRFLIEALKHA